MRGKTCAVLASLGLLVAAGCSNTQLDPDDPGSVALHLFALAADEPDQEQLATIFDPDMLSQRGVPLLDALDVIAGSAAPDLLGVDTAPGVDEAFVDLAVALPGEGRAVYNVKLRRSGELGWRIAWFQGPGVEWPARGRRGESLTTSAPPEPSSDGW